MRPDSHLVVACAPSPNFGDRRGKAIDALVLHYTGMRTGAEALARLCDPDSGVSCHYLVWEDGTVTQLVAERDRAWHAGVGSWAGEIDINSVSIGIEIVNPGHDGGAPPYPDSQIEAVVALCKDISTRHAIPAHRVLAHSDVAPGRKRDPGEWFPWARLAAAGIGLWVEPPPPDSAPAFALGEAGAAIGAIQELLRDLGYACPASCALDAATEQVVVAFQRHYRPARADGRLDLSTIASLGNMWDIVPRDERCR